MQKEPDRRHDASYKLFFSHRAVLEELIILLYGIFAEKLDFSTAIPLSAEYVDDRLAKQCGDMLWLVKRRDGGRDIIVVIEFQSDIQKLMTSRMMRYVGGTHLNMERWGLLKSGDLPPHAIPICVYNGEREWPGVPSVFSLRVPELVSPELRELLPPELRSGAEDGLSEWIKVVDMRRLGARVLPAPNVVHSMGRMEHDPFGPIDEVRLEVRGRFSGRRASDVRKSFDLWLAELARAWNIPESKIKLLIGGAKMQQTMIERRREYERDWKAQGVELGKAQGVELGKAQGVELGKAQFAARLARRKFGAETAERVLAALEGADAERIVEVFDAVWECGTAPELLARIGAV